MRKGSKGPRGEMKNEMKSKDQILKARQRKQNIEKRLRFKSKPKRGGMSKGRGGFSKGRGGMSKGRGGFSKGRGGMSKGNKR